MMCPPSELQINVLRLVSQGMTNKQIGRHLGKSPETINDIVARVSKNLGARGRVNAVYVAAKAGVI